MILRRSDHPWVRFQREERERAEAAANAEAEAEHQLAVAAQRAEREQFAHERAIQQAFDHRNRRAADAMLVRVGISVGDADVEDGDYFGVPVVEAARLCARSDGGEILASDMVRLLVDRRPDRGRTGRFDPINRGCSSRC